MEIKLAKTAGFCFGVKRAVDMVYEQLDSEKRPIYTYGPIIHNEEVVAELEEKGVQVIPEDADVSSFAPGVVILRSHGVSKSVRDAIVAAGHEVVDATCPFVLKIHKAVSKYSSEGYYILVVGDASHPEVQGIVGWIDGDAYQVISDEEDLHKLPEHFTQPICIVSQTTFNYNKFQELVEIIKQKGYDIVVLNTICNATEERQKEAAEIAASVDAMIVVGGKHSSNTQKLFEICSKECEKIFYIQTKDDLDLSILQSICSVGITAGASTPNNIIEEVQKYVRRKL